MAIINLSILAHYFRIRLAHSGNTVLTLFFGNHLPLEILLTALKYLYSKGIITIMSSIKLLESEISALKERNAKVEADKSWETSFTRRFLLMAFTYIAIGAYLNAIKVEQPWLNAIVPALGFMLSTLTLPFFKEMWLRLKKK